MTRPAAKKASSSRPSNLTLAAFASPAFSIGALGLPIVIFLPPLYAEIGLNLALVGGVFMVTRFWDILTDPVLGVFGDRLQTKWGRRRPVLVASVPILMISVYLAFNPSQGASQYYLLATLLLLYVGWTMFTLSHTAWASELSPDYHERSRIMSMVQGAGAIGALGIVFIPASFDALMPDSSLQLKASAMGTFIVLTLPVLVLLALRAVNERSTRLGSGVHWRQGLRAIVDNTPLRFLLAADLLLGLQAGINGSLHVFFVSDVLAMPNAASGYILLIFLSSILFLPFWLRLSYRTGKHRALCIGASVSAVASFLVYFVPAQALVPGAIVYFLIGVSHAGAAAMLRSIMSDVIDTDTLSTGQDRGALFFAMLGMTGKLGLALAVGITYPVLNWIGYDASGTNDQATLDGVRWVMAATPALVGVAVAGIMWRFPLDEASQSDVARKLRLRTTQPPAIEG